MGVRYLAGFLSMLPIVYWEQRYHNHCHRRRKKAFFSCPSGGNPCHLPYGGDRFSATGNVLHDSGQGGVHYEPFIIVIVPFFAYFVGQPLRRTAIIGSLLAMIGMYFLAYLRMELLLTAVIS